VLLTITTTHAPATDLGYLLHKHPDRIQSFAVSAGEAHVFYPEAAPGRCTAALLLEIDPVTLVRGHKNGDLTQYVNDRPYAASSMLAVAIKEAFRTALTGRCDARPELAAARIPLELHVPALRCRGGKTLADRVFAPLGWQVGARAQPFTPPEWGDSPYLDLRLAGQLRLADALNHLYVLLPVLDDAKHYWVSTDEIDKLIRAGGAEGGWLAGHPEKALITRRYLAHKASLFTSALARLADIDDAEPASLDDAKHYWVSTEEVDKLIRAGSGWLAGHPEKELITRRYLSHRKQLTRSALARLAEADDTDPGELDNAVTEEDTDTEPRKPLAVQRRQAILAVLREAGARRVGDLGCGAGALTRDLLADKQIEHVTAVDVSARALRLAARHLRLDQMPDTRRERLAIFQSSLTYRDDRLAGLDAAVLMEVIEHLDPDRLPALERVVFREAAPATVVVTTPNAEYNAHFETLPAGALRHHDHRFEWTRAEFRGWAEQVAATHQYQVRFLPVGPEDPQDGPPTQLAVFTRQDAAGEAASWN